MAVEYQVEVNFDGRLDGTNVLLLDGTEPTDVVSVKTKLGRSNNAFLYGQTVAGRATVVLRDAVTERKYDPVNTESELFGLLEPNQPIRFRFLRSDGNWRPYWHGYIDDVKYKNGTAFNTVTIKCLGEMERLQQNVSLSLRSGESTGELMKDLMDASDVEYSQNAEDYEGGPVIVQYQVSNQKALNELRKLEVSDGGIIFEQRFGNIARRKENEYDGAQIPIAQVLLDDTAAQGAPFNALRTLPANNNVYVAIGADLDFSRRSIANYIQLRSSIYQPGSTPEIWQPTNYRVPADDIRGPLDNPVQSISFDSNAAILVPTNLATPDGYPNSFNRAYTARGLRVVVNWGFDAAYYGVDASSQLHLTAWTGLTVSNHEHRRFFVSAAMEDSEFTYNGRTDSGANIGHTQQNIVNRRSHPLVWYTQYWIGPAGTTTRNRVFDTPPRSIRIMFPTYFYDDNGNANGFPPSRVRYTIDGLKLYRYTQQTVSITSTDPSSIATYGQRRAEIEGVELTRSHANTFVQRYRKPQALYAVSMLVEDNSFVVDLNIDDRVRVWAIGKHIGDYRITAIENDIGQGSVHIVKWELSPAPTWTPIETLEIEPVLPTSVSASQATNDLLRTSRGFSVEWSDGLNDPRYYGGQAGYLPTAYMKVDAELLNSDGQRKGNLVSLVNQSSSDAAAQPLIGQYTSSTSTNFSVLPVSGDSVRFILTLYDDSGSDIEIRTAGEVSIT